MPDKLTDKEIVKALKEILKIMLVMGDLQKASTISKSLDLINHLQAENERLKNNPTLPKSGFINLLCDALIYTETLEQYNKFRRTLKAEVYKECIEKVKNEIDSQSHSRSLEASGERFRIHKILDNLLKELVGD